MLVYHGSNLAIEKPRLLAQNEHLDFGPGFYTTTNRLQAEELSLTRSSVEKAGGFPP